MDKSILYKPESAFILEGSKATLKKYKDEVVSLFGSRGDLILPYGRGVREPKEVLGVDLEENSFFNEIKRTTVSDTLSYHWNNFTPFENGTIRFQVKTENNRGYSQIKLLGLKENVVIDRDWYLLRLNVRNNDIDTVVDIKINIRLYSDIEAQLDEIVVSLENATDSVGTIPNFSSLISITKSGSDIVFKANQPNYYLSILDTFEEDVDNSELGRRFVPRDILTLFDAVSRPLYFSTPLVDIPFLSLEGNSDYIRFIHKTDGYLYVEFDNAGEVPLFFWNRSSHNWMEIELSFSETNLFCFRDGELVSVNTVRIPHRVAPQTDLVLKGTAEDKYSFSQIALFSKIQHTSNYLVDVNPVSEYSTFEDTPHLEIHFGPLLLRNGKSVSIDGNGDIKYSLKDGDIEVIPPLSKDNFQTAFSNSPDKDFRDLIIKVEFLGEGNFNDVFLNQGQVEPNQDSTDPANFNNIFDFIRRSLGYPRVAVELTDDQLLDALNQSVFQYNRYRNYRNNLESINTVDLESHEDGSFYLPAGIDESDIIEILFRPRFSWSWYSGDNSLMANMYMQNLFSGYNLAQSAADYYINISTQNDLKNIFGSQSGWSVSNGRLYLYPRFPGFNSMIIGIKYRETISLEEINSNVQIRQLALAYAKITLGNIRSTFGNQIPGGDAMIQLNGADLIQQGQAERDMYIAEFMKQQPILPFIWT